MAGGEEVELDAAADVIAHSFYGVIDSAAVIIGGVETLRTSWDRMTGQQRDMVMDMVLEQSHTIQKLLAQVTGRTPAELHAAIERHAAVLAAAEDATGDR